MHTYTAEEVVRETQGWPRTMSREFSACHGRWVKMRENDGDNGCIVPPDVAAHAAVGAGLVWLGGKEIASVEFAPVPTVRLRCKDEHGRLCNVVAEFPTALAAVSAAVRWVMEQQKKEGAK